MIVAKPEDPRILGSKERLGRVHVLQLHSQQQEQSLHSAQMVRGQGLCECDSDCQDGDLLKETSNYLRKRQSTIHYLL